MCRTHSAISLPVRFCSSNGQENVEAANEFVTSPSLQWTNWFSTMSVLFGNDFLYEKARTLSIHQRAIFEERFWHVLTAFNVMTHDTINW